MNPKPTLVGMAVRNLTRSRFRSGLACAGIAIGVFAIAALGIFGNVLAVEATSTIGEIGSEVVVTPNGEEGYTSIPETVVDEIERATSGTPSAAILTASGLAASRGETASVTFYGTENPGAVFEASEGSLPRVFRTGAAVGSEVAERLSLRVGDRIETEVGSYRIVAVLQGSETQISPVSPDEAVVVPETALGTGGGYDQVVLSGESGGGASEAADAVRETVNARENRVTVFELSSVVEEIDDFFSLLSGFLISLGAISLIVAGVSILNVMMMSVVERRGEIGVMRAVGGQRGDVVRIILIEAVALGVVGSVFGVALTSIAVAALYYLTPVGASAVFDPGTFFYLGTAFGVGVAVSVLSGIYPAWSAANEDPVDAIRD
ncbi:ABC transporter permease [Haladaptatus sp. F3-133]|uniref:ABC transporter permease n=1 Tax=Halorutilus salinus TaxID=2487751 RepID=A0A9Q4C220_9EURY|nr:ABC transporter permease [Halorutilus salinus]